MQTSGALCRGQVIIRPRSHLTPRTVGWRYPFSPELPYRLGSNRYPSPCLRGARWAINTRRCSVRCLSADVLQWQSTCRDPPTQHGSPPPPGYRLPRRPTGARATSQPAPPTAVPTSLPWPSPTLPASLPPCAPPSPSSRHSTPDRRTRQLVGLGRIDGNAYRRSCPTARYRIRPY